MYKVTYEKYAAYPGPVQKTAAASTPSTTEATNTTPAASGSGSGGYRGYAAQVAQAQAAMLNGTLSSGGGANTNTPTSSGGSDAHRGQQPAPLRTHHSEGQITSSVSGNLGVTSRNAYFMAASHRM